MSMSLFTDALGSLDWGIYWSGHWIQSHWSGDQVNRGIVWKELFAIASAVNTWGHHWPRKKVFVHCNNQAVVEIWKKGTTNCQSHLPCSYALLLCSTHVIVTHIAGTDNYIADALSRFQVHHFYQLAPRTATNPDTTRAWPIQLLRDCSATINL